MLRFVWVPGNISHIAVHDVTPAEAEAAFAAEDFRTGPAEQKGRHVASATLAGRVLQLVYAKSGPGEVYVITAHWVLAKRRKPR
ncbi:MAG: hypothetical protein KIT72_19125 [Polyangiaceae bacterium]|nr:hypothetical protein [Polyangiaceae bacterium]MCW5792533.1 hypothetical protein [Polyangiaceae bacterium]